MATIRDWQAMKDMSSRLLVERTGEDLTAWNQRFQNEHLQDLRFSRYRPADFCPAAAYHPGPPQSCLAPARPTTYRAPAALQDP